MRSEREALEARLPELKAAEEAAAKRVLRLVDEVERLDADRRMDAVPSSLFRLAVDELRAAKYAHNEASFRLFQVHQRIGQLRRGDAGVLHG